MAKYATLIGNWRNPFGPECWGNERRGHRHGPHQRGHHEEHEHPGEEGHSDGERWEAQPGGRGHRGGDGPGGGGHGGGRGGWGGGRGGWGGLFGFGGFPFGGAPGPFGRGQRARRGDVRAGILALLAEQPRNGYQIMQELEARSRGMWRPSPGSVYPALQLLEDEGLVSAAEAGAGRVYQLTEQGRKYVAEHADETQAPWESQASAESEEAFDLLGQIRHIGPALWQIANSGNAAQIAEARKVLNEARRALYAILAQDPDAEE
jgi:DNA-binding PadR family transcriptional regulator